MGVVQEPKPWSQSAIGHPPRHPLTIVAVMLAAAMVAVVPSAATTRSAVLPSVALLLLLSVAAVRLKSQPVRQSVLLADLLFVTVAVKFLGLWPVPAAAAVIVAWWLASRGSGEHQWASWLRRGRWTRDLPWLVVTTVIVTAVALTAWQRLFDGRLPREYVDAARGHPWWLIVLAGIGFSLLNAAVEEVVFRGVLMSALLEVLGLPAAVVLQAVAFGVLHLHGVPSGIVGMVMAGAWGLLLGLLRLRSRGLLAPYAAHIAADATIVMLMLPALTSSST